MTSADWLAATGRWIQSFEGLRLWKYRDSKGIVTLGWGFNLAARGYGVWVAAGAREDEIRSAPTAVDGLLESAVTPCVTRAQADEVFFADLPGYVAATRALFPDGTFDRLDDGRRCAVTDLGYNMGTGELGLGGFHATIALLARAVDQKAQGHLDAAHALFGEAGDHLASSDYASDVPTRAAANIAVIRSSVWTPPLAA